MPASEADAHARYLRGLQIIEDVVFARLDRPVRQTDRRGRPDGYRAFAPCHEDIATRSLSISPGLRKDVVWRCFACEATYGLDEAQRRTREALIHVSRVPLSALKWSAAETEGFAEKVDRLYELRVKGAAFQLWVRAYRESYDRLPFGEELLGLAGRANVGDDAAFRALREQRAGRGPTTDSEFIPPARSVGQTGEVIAGQLAS